MAIIKYTFGSTKKHYIDKITKVFEKETNPSYTPRYQRKEITRLPAQNFTSLHLDLEQVSVPRLSYPNKRLINLNLIVLKTPIFFFCSDYISTYATHIFWVHRSTT